MIFFVNLWDFIHTFTIQGIGNYSAGKMYCNFTDNSQQCVRGNGSLVFLDHIFLAEEFTNN